jgi:hypothetical protein
MNRRAVSLVCAFLMDISDILPGEKKCAMHEEAGREEGRYEED